MANKSTRNSLNNSKMADDEPAESEDLLSMEKMDSESPEIWPEKIPGVNDYIARTNKNIGSSPPAWQRGLKQEDINNMQRLAALSTQGLIKEICKLNDEVYNLGVVEAKEMSRGRHLNIFQIPKEPKKKM